MGMDIWTSMGMDIWTSMGLVILVVTPGTGPPPHKPPNRLPIYLKTTAWVVM